MFAYNNQTYHNVFFTSDEHYGSSRHITLSNRIGLSTEAKREKELTIISDQLNTTELSDRTKRAIMFNLRHSHYGATVIDDDTEIMDQTFITNHNEIVGDEDIVFHLGVFGDYETAQFLNGYHVLIMGNYEVDDCAKRFNNDFIKFREYILSNYNFIDVLENYTIHLDTSNTVPNGLTIPEVSQLYLTHKPTDGLYNWNTKEYKYNPDGTLIMNVFGHIHEKAKIKRHGVNVGVDANHYYPMSAEILSFYLYAILHYYDEDVFC